MIFIIQVLIILKMLFKITPNRTQSTLKTGVQRGWFSDEIKGVINFTI